MTDRTTPQTPEEPQQHRHADSVPTSNTPRTVLIIVLAALVVIAVIVIVLLVTRTPGPAPTPTNTPTASVSPAPSPTSTTPAAVGDCTTDNSTATLGAPDGAAGSTTVPLVFTNTGTVDCTLEGYPVVAFVGDENGTQIGAAAAEDTASAVAKVTLVSGGTATAALTITEASNIDDCDPVDVDGLRVTPPGSNDAFFVATTDYQACNNTSAAVLTIGAVTAP